MANVQQKKIMPAEMEFNSKEVEAPKNFYLRSLEEQVRGELEDSKATLTQTESEGRVLLQINKDSLQQFLDILHQHKNGDVHNEICSLKAQLKETATKLQKVKGDVETSSCAEMQLFKNFCQTKQDEQLDAIIKLKAALDKSKQDLNTQITFAKKDKETFWNLVKARLAEQTQINDNTKSAYDKIQRDLKKERLQWQQERSSLTSQLEKLKAETNENLKVSKDRLDTCYQEKFGVTAQLKCSLTKLQTRDNDIKKLTIALKKCEYQKACLQSAQLEKSNSCEVDHDSEKKKNDDLLAAVKKAEQQLESRTVEWQQERSSFKAKLEKSCTDLKHAEQTQINNKTKSAFDKIEQELKKERLQWQQERSSLTSQLEKLKAETNENLKVSKDRLDTCYQEKFGVTAQLKCSLTKLQTRDNDIKKLTIALKKCEYQKACLQSAQLEKSNSCEVDHDSEKKKNDDLLAAVKKAEQQLESRTIEWQQERSSFKAKLEETYTDLEHAKQRNIAAVRTMEKEAATMFERNQASRDELEEQTAETNKIARTLKETEDLLEKQRLRILELTSQLETSKSHCVTTLETQKEDHKEVVAALWKKCEDERENERLEWHQMKSYLLKTTEQSLEREKEMQKDKACLLSQVEDLQRQTIKKPKKKCDLPPNVGGPSCGAGTGGVGGTSRGTGSGGCCSPAQKAVRCGPAWRE
uniref:calponin homology domain-containing protein DDB_G0272472-like n=1 Tax=Gasterosteus aculeatus aculeatus TaxID=481459 RepID=UPI001A99797A|nr:calponin homology domain-containing protein DDB_G0272472-like [Gasterosteus aculeatus aculeatus]